MQYNELGALFRALHRDLDTAETSERNWAEFLRCCRTLERRFVRTMTDPSTRIEIKRIVKMRALDGAYRRRVNYDVCHRLFKELCRLGFGSVDTQADFVLMHARYSVEAGHTDGAEEVLNTLIARLHRGVASIERARNHILGKNVK